MKYTHSCICILISAFLTMHIFQCVYGGLSVNDCGVPAIIATVMGASYGSVTLYGLIRYIRDIDRYSDSIDISWWHYFHIYVQILVSLVAQCTIIVLLLHCDNGECQHERHLRNIAIALITFQSVQLLLVIYGQRTRSQAEQASEPEPEPV